MIDDQMIQDLSDKDNMADGGFKAKYSLDITEIEGL